LCPVFSAHKEKTISVAFWILSGLAFQQPARDNGVSDS
jgi:hypothetical protein